jgi:outer membrane protein, heavy metal efflux system
LARAAQLELTRAEAELATARTFVRAAQVRLANAIAILSTLIGVPLASDVNVLMPPEPGDSVPTLAQLREEMLQRYPALMRNEALIRQADSQIQLQRALRKPQPTARVEWEHQPDLGFLRVGVSVPLPIWNRREGPIGEAIAARTEASANAEAVRLQLLAQLDRAYSLYEIATQQIESLEQGSLREAEAALQAAEAALRYGERGIIDVLDAQRILRSVRADYLDAIFDRRSALIEIEQLRAADLEAFP